MLTGVKLIKPIIGEHLAGAYYPKSLQGKSKQSWFFWSSVQSRFQRITSFFLYFNPPVAAQLHTDKSVCINSFLRYVAGALCTRRHMCYLSEKAHHSASALCLSSVCNQSRVPLTAWERDKCSWECILQLAWKCFRASGNRCKLNRCNKMTVEVGESSWTAFFWENLSANKV